MLIILLVAASPPSTEGLWEGFGSAFDTSHRLLLRLAEASGSCTPHMHVVLMFYCLAWVQVHRFEGVLVKEST